MDEDELHEDREVNNEDIDEELDLISDELNQAIQVIKWYSQKCIYEKRDDTPMSAFSSFHEMGIGISAIDVDKGKMARDFLKSIGEMDQ